MAISPRGGIVLCEDDASDGNHAQPGENPNFDVSPYHGGSRNRLVGLTIDGKAFAFAENAFNEAELAGACWSRRRVPFCNIFGDDVPGSGRHRCHHRPVAQGSPLTTLGIFGRADWFSRSTRSGLA